MPVTNVVLKEVEARRFQDPQGPQQIRIDHNSNIQLVSAEGDIMKVEFGYTTSYGALGVVKLTGTVQYRGDDAKAAAAQWGESRQLPQELAQQVHQAIMATCMPEAVGLSKTVRLPPPIPMPQVNIGGNQAAASQPAQPIDSPEVG